MYRGKKCSDSRFETNAIVFFVVVVVNRAFFPFRNIEPGEVGNERNLTYSLQNTRHTS